MLKRNEKIKFFFENLLDEFKENMCVDPDKLFDEKK